MRTAELRELDYEELSGKLAEAKAELFNLRFQLATNQLENTAQLRTTRREIARLATLLREMELDEWRKTSDSLKKSDRKRS
ncbi:MAG TPA: 50S ribosomal protein L29 [Acidimicrobiia bacterium]